MNRTFNTFTRSITFSASWKRELLRSNKCIVVVDKVSLPSLTHFKHNNNARTSCVFFSSIPPTKTASSTTPLVDKQNENPIVQQQSLKEDDEPLSNNNEKDKNEKELIFPWISSKTPQPRLIQMDDLSGLGNSFRSRFGKRLSAALEMNVPFWDFLITKTWETELAENCTWAFRMAVCGLLSRTFQVAFWDIKNTDEMIYLNTRTKAAATDKSTIPTVKATTTLDETAPIDNNEEESNRMTEEDKKASSNYVESMMEKRLLNLYHPSAHDIYFQLKPIASRLESAFLVTSITRKDVIENPSLKGAYTNISNEWKKSKSVSILRQMADELHSKTSHKGAYRSIIVDVSVDCLEAFQITDKETGTIVQSSGGDEGDLFEEDKIKEENVVTHLVRFEMVTSKGKNRNERNLGTWQIIDIDDMLNGNVWH